MLQNTLFRWESYILNPIFSFTWTNAELDITEWIANANTSKHNISNATTMQNANVK